MVVPRGISPRSIPCQGSALMLSYGTLQMVGDESVALSIFGCRPNVILFHQPPIKWCSLPDLHWDYVSFEARLTVYCRREHKEKSVNPRR